VENFRPSSLQRIGIDYPALAALNPRLVYCAISGYGPDGPRSDWPSMDIAIQAASGFMSRNGFPDGPPIKAGPTIGDQVPAVYAALGIFAALRQREHTGRGQLVDVAMNDVMTSLVWDDHLDWYAQRGLGERWGNADPRGGPLNVYQASDGWVAIVVSSDAQWAGLCRLMDRDDLLAATPTSADRRRELPDLDDAVRRWCGTRPAEQVANALREVGIAGARVASALEARQDPQVASRRMLRPLRRSDAPSSDSGFVGTALPVHFGGYEPVHEPAEPLGNSTASVLSEFLGLGEEELSRLKRKGVIQH
jgi:crotonobetainyl-CoA:carnitine CoA-transferase CaiB-like acyl-CoA transferase